MTRPGRLLFVASEVFPLIKTGGLADVASSLPTVLQRQGADVRILLPGYQGVLERIETSAEIARLTLAGEEVAVLETSLPGSNALVWLLDHPLFSGRAGNPYHDEDGYDWPDNAERFMLLSRLAAAISVGESPLDWQPDVLHCNDWHTGPAIALTHLHESRPRTVFTIHNLAHMGMFDYATFEQLQLPAHFFSGEAMEFYGRFCFMKGGLVYADWITTVSPTYAEEICYSPGGMGLEGLLSHRREHLVGILNGIDEQVWNPRTDPLLAANYDVASLDGKLLNKRALQAQLGLECSDELPLFGFVGRLAQQKGLELLLPVLDELLASPAQLVVLGTGDPVLEEALQSLAECHPDSVAVILAYNETLAHRIEAAADIFLMPSLFEPCGLNQLYSLRYGTLPLVRAVGGLADTVTDATAENLAAGTATGFVFAEPQPSALLDAARRALDLWQDQDSWHRLQEAAMGQEFSWECSAHSYLELYGFDQHCQIEE